VAALRIVTVVFGGEPYETLARVFERSVEIAMPAARFTRLECPVPVEDGRPWDCRMNTAKLRLWIEAAERYPGDNLVLADCDMLAVGDAAAAFADRDYDIGYTTRASLLPLNGGILFVRPTRAARRWLRALWQVNEDMRTDPEFHGPWRRLYHGMNQAAMGCLIEYPLKGVRVRAFPGARFNMIGQSWVALGPESVFIHVKSTLRRAVLGEQLSPRDERLCRAAAERWRQMRDS
jgi:hypothetical protein